MLWQLDSESVQPVKWNDDWDSSPIVIGDYMIVGSESSRFWVVKLNRSYDAAGLVQVAPEVVFTDEAWDDQVIADNGGDQHASVESSVTVVGDVAYFGTSAGLVLGYDLAGIEDGATPTQVFRFYTAGDNDASIVADDEGMLYASAQNDRPDNPRAVEVGQLQKLDPSKPDNPIVWSFQETTAKGQGIYGTPAVVGDIVYVTSAGGRLIALDKDTGAVLWERTLAGPAWASPVVVDDVLLIGDCLEGNFHAFDVSDPTVAPPELWSVNLGGCIEATPAVWKGRIYIGSRAGHLYTLEWSSSLACAPGAARLRPRAPRLGVGRPRRGLRRSSAPTPPPLPTPLVAQASSTWCSSWSAVMSTGLSCQRYSRRLRPLAMTWAASSRPTYRRCHGS